MAYGTNGTPLKSQVLIRLCDQDMTGKMNSIIQLRTGLSGLSGFTAEGRCPKIGGFRGCVRDLGVWFLKAETQRD